MTSKWSRRRVLGTGGALLGGGLAASAWTDPAHAAGGADPWVRAERIRRRVRPPVFPARWFPITDFGAVGDGVTDCTQAFHKAITACARQGGGHVVVPPGRFSTGAIRLLSRVDLHVSAGATIAFSTDPAKYLPAVFTRWQGIECFNYSALIYAFGARDIAITGEGTLDGQATTTAWWPWSGDEEDGWVPGTPNQDDDWTLLQAMADQGLPVERRVFGDGHFLRPNFIQPYRCRNVLVEGVTLVNSPMWEIHPVLSRSVLVRDVTVVSHGPNNDGCDPESCTDVVIAGCTFDTGDDCVAIKSGRNADGRRVDVPSQNILIEDCEFRDGHGGVTMGSEMTGGVSGVFARNVRMTSPNIRSALRLKTNSLRGGFITDVHLRDVEVSEVTFAGIEIDFFYEDVGPGQGFDPSVGDVNVENLHVGTTQFALNLRGYPNDPIRGVVLEHCAFDHASAASVVEDVEGLRLIDVTINGEPAGTQVLAPERA